ncbi:MAG: hypothetical protein GC171_03090 [Terrimonas sp.]|nr:hypothetical protein [Terrimonas sp.]
MPCLEKYVIVFFVMWCQAYTLDAQTGQSSPYNELPSPGSPVGHPAKDSAVIARPFFVRKIYISGNKRTKESIILRELPFRENEEYALQDLVARFEDARRQLMNTALFHDVIVALKRFDGYNVDITVEVKERWYLFPLPYFKPVDRNFNQWLIEQKGNLNRVDYGLKIIHNNTTGRNDKLNVWLVNGYTKRVSLSYDRLYIEKSMKWGMRTSLNLGSNREVNYATANNKQVFYKDENRFVRSFFNASAELTYRKAIKTRHRFGLGYSSEKVIDTIRKLNPSYLYNNNTRIRYPELYYIMNYFDVDFIPYPLKGYLAEVSVNKKGLNKSVNLWQTTVKVGGNWPIARKTWLGLRVAGNLKLPFKQPFYNQRLLGYSDFFMQGYEYYVLDGVAGGYLKTTVTKQLLGFNIKMPIKKSTIESIPFKVYVKAYSNMGYVYNPEPGNNNLNNKMLYSGGVGIDIVTFYDFVMRFEWSFNQLGQNGLYLHRKSYY